MIDLDAPPPAPFRILIVSEADVARGPATRHLLRAHLRSTGSGGDTVVSSAGTAARDGEGIRPSTLRALAALGAAEVADGLTAHAAHRLSERRLAQADLILAVSRDECRRAVELRPGTRSRSFTLIEFARLVSALPDAGPDPQGLVRQAAGLRAAVRPVDPAEDDLDGADGPPDLLLRRIDHAAADIGRGLSGSLAVPGLIGP